MFRLGRRRRKPAKKIGEMDWMKRKRVAGSESDESVTPSIELLRGGIPSRFD